jgi:hypothetical protein
LPKRVKPESCEPQSLRSFEVQTVAGEWRAFKNVDLLDVLWKKDFQLRRTQESYKTLYYHSVDGFCMVYLRKLKPNRQRKERKTKEHSRRVALALCHDTNKATWKLSSKERMYI